MKNKYQDFDIFSFLNDYNIEYKESGTNIGRNWLGVSECVFCGAPNFHLGLHKKSKNINCFVCGGSGTLFTFIKEVLKINSYEVKNIISKYSNGYIDFKEITTGSEVILPSNMQESVPKSAFNYLKSRKFNAFRLKEKYGIQFTKNYSVVETEEIRQDFAYRIVVPIFYKNKLVSYTARDYTGLGDPKYRHPEKTVCIEAPADIMYNTGSVKDRAVIVEGVTDVWRMGDESISGQGIKFTKNQINQIRNLNLKRVAILLDENAEKQAEKLAEDLRGIVPDIRIGYLDSGDPGDLSDKEAFLLKRKLLYK